LSENRRRKIQNVWLEIPILGEFWVKIEILSFHVSYVGNLQLGLSVGKLQHLTPPPTFLIHDAAEGLT